VLLFSPKIAEKGAVVGVRMMAGVVEAIQKGDTATFIPP